MLTYLRHCSEVSTIFPTPTLEFPAGHPITLEQAVDSRYNSTKITASFIGIILNPTYELGQPTYTASDVCGYIFFKICV